ncbi:hypothetical protein N8224_04570 [Gammaproteobacteria bacterium]|jgi:hypothetical protein|nr:hypothetical protein [Gammaproteobacteria bacterium]
MRKINKKFLIFILIFLTACDGDRSKSSAFLSDFIKPQFTHQESSMNCLLASGQTLNSVERFVPTLVNMFKQSSHPSDEVTFLFPVLKDIEVISQFKIKLKHNNLESRAYMNKTLTDKTFSEIASCNLEKEPLNSIIVRDHQRHLTSEIIEVVDCRYLEGYSYATIKLVFERLIDSLGSIQHSPGLIYSSEVTDTNIFRWSNIFSSIDARELFLNSWLSKEASKELQSLFIEQSSCNSSVIYRSYRVI